MDFLKDLKVSFKLVILLLIALFAMTLIGYTGYYYLQQSNVDMKGMYKERLIPVKEISMIRTDVAKSNAAVMELMITTDDKKNVELKKTIDDSVKESNELFAELEKSNLDVRGKELVAKTQITKQKYRVARQDAIELALKNKNVEAYLLYNSSVEPLTLAYMQDLQDLLEYYSTLSEKTNVETQANFEKAIQIAMSIFAFSLLLLMVSGFYISSSITKPLNSMVTTCKELALGDFRDKPRKVLRKDEIGQVADALADTRSAVRELMKKINESSEQLAASSEELTASAEQSALAANQVAESIHDVAVGAEKQSVVANTTSDIVGKISTNIQQVAVSANDVASQSAQAASKANDGNRSVEKAISQMDNIEKTVTSSAQVVSKLGERSKEIGQIVDTISGIAGQTNLLALNAAIEAARAGEQGRGFAVVAEEVRKLAEQSQEAAKQIALLISEIQGDTDKAVVAMNAGTHEVKLGAEVVNASGYAFKEIASLVEAVSNQIKDISTSIEEMSTGSQQIVKSVQEIDGLSKTVSGEAQTVSAATEEQSATMEEIASASQTLSVMAVDLQKAVHTFQI